jgi:GNAT superfamily N-acetyltransferase
MKDFLSTLVQLPDDIEVRFGVREDVSVVFSFMKELAVIRGGNASMVKISEDDLIQDGFTDSKYFYLVVAEKTHGGCSSSCVHELIGFGMYYFSYSTWEGLTVSVEDLYVKKEHRQNNVGTALLQRIAQFAIEHDCHRLAWNHTNGNEPAFQFFKHHKAILLPEWKKMYLDNPTLTALADEVTRSLLA